MKYHYLLLLVFIGFIGCGDDNKPKSGVSSVVMPTDRTESNKTPETPTSTDANPNPSGMVDVEQEFVRRENEVKEVANNQLEVREDKLVRVSGTLLNAQGLSITLEKLGGRKNYEPISTTIINDDGYFELDATTNQEQIFNLKTDEGNIILFLDGGNYTVSGDIKEISKYKVNAPESFKVRDFFLILESFNEGRSKLKKREDRYTEQKKAWKIQRMLDSMHIINDKIEKQRFAALKNFIDQNKTSVVAALALNRLDFLRHTAYIESIYSELAKKYPYSDYVKDVGVKLIRMRHLAVGKVAPDITMADMDGVNHRLSDLRGKYALITITAAFSTTCVDDALSLVPIYNRFQPKGFEIYNITIDESREEWSRYIEETGAPWIVVSDLLGQKTTAFDNYLAMEYPMTYLIDKQGIIIEKFLFPADVERALEERL